MHENSIVPKHDRFHEYFGKCKHYLMSYPISSERVRLAWLITNYSFINNLVNNGVDLALLL